MEVNKKEGKILNEAIKEWERRKLISSEEAERLSRSFTVINFDWGLLAKYSFWIAIVCAVIAFLSLVVDDVFIGLVELIVSTDLGAIIFFSGIASVFYYWGSLRRKTRPEKIFSNETILFAGAFFTAVAIGFVGNAFDSGSGHFSILFFLATLIYIPLAVHFRSLMIWVLAMASLSFWFGAETAYWSDWDEYFLGLSFPVRYVIWGGLLTAVSVLLSKQEKLALFAPATLVIGLWQSFWALWVLSLSFWFMRTEWAFSLAWMIVLIIASVATIIQGIKREDTILKATGFFFFFWNIYTKFFEYLWDEVHVAILFSILALSFWLIGSRAEELWSGKFIKGNDDLLDELMD